MKSVRFLIRYPVKIRVFLNYYRIFFSVSREKTPACCILYHVSRKHSEAATLNHTILQPHAPHIRVFILIIILLLNESAFLTAEWSDYAASVAEAFSSLTDENAGSTSFRSLYIPSGGRAESMGTAFTALSNDIGFFEYNAAASSTMDETQFGVFHNAWIADSALETVAYTKRKDNFGWGGMFKCFYVPFTEYDLFGERVTSGYYSESTALLNLSYNFFSNYGFKGVALGMNLKGAYRSMPDYGDDATGKVIPGSGLEQSAAAVMADVGLQMRFNILKFFQSRTPNFYVGLSFTNAGVSWTKLSTSPVLDDPLPSRLAAGIAWQCAKPVYLSFEFQQPVNLMDISSSEQWSAGAGLYVQVASLFAVETGFMLKGASPRLTLGSEFDVLNFKMNVNYTLDMTSSKNPLNHISVSAKLKLGDEGRQQKQDEIDRLYIEGLKLYKNGYFEEAAYVWNQILLMDKSFTPAVEAVAIAEKAAALQRQIVDIQSLD